jgi:hypothetical protein
MEVSVNNKRNLIYILGPSILGLVMCIAIAPEKLPTVYENIIGFFDMFGRIYEHYTTSGIIE